MIDGPSGSLRETAPWRHGSCTSAIDERLAEHTRFEPISENTVHGKRKP